MQSTPVITRPAVCHHKSQWFGGSLYHRHILLIKTTQQHMPSGFQGLGIQFDIRQYYISVNIGHKQVCRRL